MNAPAPRPAERTLRAPMSRPDEDVSQRDVRLQQQVMDALRQEPWIAAEFVRVAVKSGVVVLSGEVDSVHGAFALRRIAAATPGATAIVDDLWISCE